jgi:RND family efflux transporter MFP subunit
MSSDLNPPGDTQPPSPRALRLIGLIGLVIVVLVVGSGIAVRDLAARRLESWTDEQSIPTVAVVQPSHLAKGPALVLPARLEAWYQAPIFARVNGYLKSWNVDIGAPVKAGQLLAVIETPELDQQLTQARADLATAQANESLARTTAQRWEAMRGTDAVAQQDVDERTADYAAKTATVAAARANLDRLVATKEFARIVAPFDGTVTARNTDVGALINAGSSTTLQELFAVSDVRQLRVYVEVPQNYAPDVDAHTVAVLTVPEHPEQTYSAHVIATANAVNVNSGTTLVQLVVDNRAGKLMPGDYASVRFDLPNSSDTLRVPASALIFNAGGLQVAIVDNMNRVSFKTVTVTRDLGDAVEIGSGLTDTDRVVNAPPDGLASGDPVRISTAGAKVTRHG